LAAVQPTQSDLAPRGLNNVLDPRAQLDGRRQRSTGVRAAIRSAVAGLHEQFAGYCLSYRVEGDGREFDVLLQYRAMSKDSLKLVRKQEIGDAAITRQIPRLRPDFPNARQQLRQRNVPHLFHKLWPPGLNGFKGRGREAGQSLASEPTCGSPAASVKLVEA
jgi:hypothetical protein